MCKLCKYALAFKCKICGFIISSHCKLYNTALIREFTKDLPKGIFTKPTTQRYFCQSGKYDVIYSQCIGAVCSKHKRVRYLTKSDILGLVIDSGELDDRILFVDLSTRVFADQDKVNIIFDDFVHQVKSLRIPTYFYNPKSQQLSVPQL